MHIVFAIIALAIVLVASSVATSMVLDVVQAKRRAVAEKHARFARLRTLEINLRHMEVETKGRQSTQEELNSYAAFIAERNSLVSVLFPQHSGSSLAFG